MPKKFDDMQPGEFEAYIDSAGLYFSPGHGRDRARPCNPGSGVGCPMGQNSTVRVFIRPEIGADQIDHKNVHPNGTVIAVLENMGRGTETQYRLPKKEREIYWIVEPGAAGEPAKSRMIVLRRNGTTHELRKNGLQFTRCEPDGHDTPPLEADFKPCEATAGFQQSRSHAWISCLEGCCVATSLIGYVDPDSTANDSQP